MSFEFVQKKQPERAATKAPPLNKDGESEHETSTNETGKFTGLAVQFSSIPIHAPAEGNAKQLSETVPACSLKTSPTACLYGGTCHLCPARIQTKLAISEPGDAYEKEADKAAQQVMQATLPNVSKLTCKAVQPKCSQCEDEQTPVQRGAGETPSFQDNDIGIHEVLKSPGQTLQSSVRAFMEHRFGHDFSQVRIHDDPRAGETARRLNAKAFTVGRDVVFGPAQYGPTTTEGTHLLAHELTHFIQQNGGRRLIQRQSIHDIGAGGGYGGLMEKDRRKMLHPERPPEPRYICGPDITVSLDKELQDVKRTFDGWSRDKQDTACSALYTPPRALSAWDTYELWGPTTAWLREPPYEECGVPRPKREWRFLGDTMEVPLVQPIESPKGCGNTVRVGGKCFLAGTVNYALFGKMCKLCSKNHPVFTEGFVKTLIWLYKKGTLSGDDPGPPTEWALAGYRGFPGNLPSEGNRPLCSTTTKCKCPPSTMRFSWRWVPNKD
jgi:hypothetical protein